MAVGQAPHSMHVEVTGQLCGTVDSSGEFIWFSPSPFSWGLGIELGSPGLYDEHLFLLSHLASPSAQGSLRFKVTSRTEGLGVKDCQGFLIFSDCHPPPITPSAWGL